MQSISLAQLFQLPGLINLSYKITSYLDTQWIDSILSYKTHKQQQQSHKQSNKSLHSHNTINPIHQTYFYKLIKTQYYIKNYLNKLDRTMYYQFYEHQIFIRNQNQLIQSIVINNIFNDKVQSLSIHPLSQEIVTSFKPILQQKIKQTYVKSSFKLTSFIDQFQNILKSINNEIEFSQEYREQIKRIFTDPCLPLPKMKRENQGIYCNSPFQLFLVNLRFGHNNDSFDDYNPFQNMKFNLQAKEQFLLRLFFQIQLNRHSHPQTYQNVHFLRYTAYEITSQNHKQLQIKDHFLHNVIVNLFALTDVYITSIMNYIELIDDPIYKFAELMCRYSIFRSFIMEIEENLGFLFSMYHTLYSDSIRDSVSNKPKFCFWRPAMSKWYLKMNKIHKQSNQIYFMVLTQLRQRNLIKILQNQKYSMLKEFEIVIKNKLEMNNFLQSLKQKIERRQNLKQNPFLIKTTLRHPGNCLLNDFFIHNSDILQLLTCEYVEYMIDLSIDEFQVHWCGYSEQILDKTYFDFQNDFLNYNKSYIDSLMKCLTEKYQSKFNKNQKHFIKLFNIFIQEDLQFLSENNIKPVTLKALIEQINKQYFTQNPQVPNYLNNNLNSLPLNETLSVEQAQFRRPIQIDFTFKDENLKYFNEKAQIIRLLDKDDKCYFSIPPLLSVQQIMTKSIDTNDSQNSKNNQENENNTNDNNNNKLLQQKAGYKCQSDGLKQLEEPSSHQQRKSSLVHIDQTSSIVIMKKTQQLQNSQQIDKQYFNSQSFQLNPSVLASSNSTKGSSQIQQQQSQQNSIYSYIIGIKEQTYKNIISREKKQNNFLVN